MEGGRGRYWTEAEVSSLLDFFIENEMGPVLFHLHPRRNQQAFREAARELARLNYARNPTQIRSKFKTIRQNFNRALFYFGEDAEEGQQSAFWNQLLELWIQAGRPDPRHLFPLGAGPGRRLGNRGGDLRPQRQPNRREALEQQANDSDEDQEQAMPLDDQPPVEQEGPRHANQGAIREEQPVQNVPGNVQEQQVEQEELQEDQPVDIMLQPVTRAEHQNWVAVLQQAVERIAALEEIVIPGNRGGAPARRRRRRR